MKRFTFPTFVLVLLTLTGCFDYDENMVINKDGSGTIEMRYAIDESYLKQIEEMNRQMAQQMGIPAEETVGATSGMFNKDEIEEALKAEESGIVMTSYEESVTDGVRNYRLNFSFEDINKLYYLYMAVYPNDEDEYETNPGVEYEGEESFAEIDSVPPTLFAEQDDGTWLFQREMADEEMSAEEEGAYGMGEEQSIDSYPEDESGNEVDFGALSDILGEQGLEEALGGLEAQMQGLEAQMQNMADQMGEHHIRFTVTFPGTIIESNATSINGNTAVWEIKLDQMQQGLSDLRAVIKP